MPAKPEFAALLRNAAPFMEEPARAAAGQALALLQRFPGKTWAEIEGLLRSRAEDSLAGPALRRRSEAFVAEGRGDAEQLGSAIQALGHAELKTLAADLGVPAAGTKAALGKTLATFVQLRGRVRPAEPAAKAPKAAVPKTAKPKADPKALAAELLRRHEVPPRNSAEARAVNEFAAEAFQKLEVPGVAAFAAALNCTLSGRSKADKLKSFQRRMEFLASSQVRLETIDRAG